MWCIRKFSVLTPAIIIALLTACGFRPLHGDGTVSDASQLANIRIGIIEDRIGQKFRNLLLDRLTPRGAPARPRYLLGVTLSEGLQSLGVRKDATATRANLTVSANFTLSMVADKTLRYTGSASSTNSYNILESDFATLSAKNNARDRALRTLSEDIRARVAAALSGDGFFRRPEPENVEAGAPERPTQ